MVSKLNIAGPKMCTTLSKEGNLSGNAECGLVDNITGEYIEGSVWHSCEEWCLSKVYKKDRYNIVILRLSYGR